MVGEPIPAVFLDANVVIQAGKPPGGPSLVRFADLVNAGLIRVLTTDLTMSEIAKRHAENDFDFIKDVTKPNFRSVVADLLDVELPERTREELKHHLREKYTVAVQDMFANLRAETLRIDTVKPSTVFGAYSTASGFFSGEGKRNQFPDAFIFECLKATAGPNSPVVIVSADGDFERPVDAHEHLTLVKSLPELFAHLGLKVEAPEVEEFFEAHAEDVREAVNRELADWGLLVADVEDAEIDDTDVTGVQVMEWVSFGSMKPKGSMLVVGRMQVDVNAHYSHPDWDGAMYDSEDQRLIPFGNVSGEREVTFEVEFSMTLAVDEAGHPEAIDELRFRNDKFQSVDLQPFETYK